MKNEIEKRIYKWVAENYGQAEADDPSWNIEGLAEAVYELRHKIYYDEERQYQEEDCDMVAENMGVELTSQQKANIVEEFMESEAYVSAHAEDWQYFIKRELEK